MSKALPGQQRMGRCKNGDYGWIVRRAPYTGLCRGCTMRAIKMNQPQPPLPREIATGKWLKEATT